MSARRREKKEVERGWSFQLAVDTRDNEPIFVRIARAMIDDIRRARLRPGDPLPGSRPLAASLGVHRNTVLAAYRELIAEGWVTTSAARGTFVSEALPDVRPRRFAEPLSESRGRVGFDLGEPPEAEPERVAPGVMSLSGGVPDVRLVPVASLARALRRVLASRTNGALGYGDPRGPRPLRDGIAAMLKAARGLAVTGDDVLVTRGSQMGIDLFARTVVRPGDVVAVESLGYRPAWVALRAAGARLVPLPLDARGVKVDALADLLAREHVRAVYVTPHHQYPTTVALAAGRRIELMALAAKHRFAIVEDDYDHEFHYDGRPILPLASADTHGSVAYLGTLSKVLAPGLRLGYVVAPPPLLERMARARASVDRQGDQPMELAVAELLEDGEVQRHIRRARRVYAARREVLGRALASDLGSALSFELPSGGTAVWARVDPAIDVEAWHARAVARGVAFQTARLFAFDGRTRPRARFGFAQLDPTELREASRRLATALRAKG